MKKILTLALGIIVAFGTYSSATAQTTKAKLDAAQEVENLISTAHYGKPPLLWLASDPKNNKGSGSPTMSAQSGGQLAARGSDPWNRPDAAFGLASDAQGGAAISGSTTTNLINPKSGTVLFFCRLGENPTPAMLLFSHADWGQSNYLSLRVNAVGARHELTLAVANPGTPGKASQTNVATLTPGAWTFVALAWHESDSFCRFRYWSGDLATGEITEGDYDVPALAPTPGLFVIAGRRTDNVAKFKTAPLLFTGGFFQHFAIYEGALPEEVIKRIYLAAARR